MERCSRIGTRCPFLHAKIYSYCPRAQRLRELSVRRKLNAMPAVFSGKKVLLVDDSIVRGTTMGQIVDMVRRAGAKKVRRLSKLFWLASLD
jgi:adenine/guanine phosphoribosyltransferase-like PRPP-binding protein